MKQIPLSTPGYVALVDDADYNTLNQYKWRAKIDSKNGRVYARAWIKMNGRWVEKTMHRFLLSDGPNVDHKDNDGLNNTRANLRYATHSQNLANASLRVDGTSFYRGVCWHAVSGRWTAQIGVNNGKKYLGLYATEEEAAQAYAKAAREQYGEFARTD